MEDRRGLIGILLGALRRSWRTLILGLGAAVLVWGLVVFYLIPANAGFAEATPQQRRAITAFSSLLLAVTLVLLLLGVLWALRRRGQ